MTTKKRLVIIRIIVLVVIVFFHTRFLSQLFLTLGESAQAEERLKFFRVSYFFFPIDYVPPYELGYTLLERGDRVKSDTDILESIRWLKRSIGNNPFYYLAHYNLGKGYFFYRYPNSQYFAEAVEAFKRAVLLNDRDLTIGLDTSKVLLSMWPLLDKGDRELCRNLLRTMVRKFDWRDFRDVIENWWLYARDIAFLQSIVRERPDFQFKAAAYFVQLGTPLNLRWSFLAEYEYFVFQQVRNDFRFISFDRNPQLAEIDELLGRLKEIKFYGRLVGEENFSEGEYVELKNSLVRKKLALLFDAVGLERAETLNAKITGYVFEHINGTDDYKHLAEFKEFLEKNKFFDQKNRNDFDILHLKYLLAFKLGNFSEVIDDIEKLESSILVAREEYKDDYADVLLILADAHEASKLLSLADRTLRKIIDISPDSLGAYWRLLKVHRILGADEDFYGRHQEMIRRVEESRLLRLDTREFKQVVYLTDKREIEVTVSEELRESMRGRHLFQVFMDGQILFEAYVGKLTEPVKVAVKEADEYSRHRVEIKLL
jgi:hypothetical protein